MCNGPKDQNRGAIIDEQLAKDKITVWGDKFSTETQTILKSLDYCGIAYNYENIETNFLGELSNDDFAYQSIHQQSKELKELMSTQSEMGAGNGGQHSKMDAALKHQLVVCDQEAFVQYIKLAKAQYKSLLFPEEKALDIKTHMIWYEQVLKPSSTRFKRAKILEMKKAQNTMQSKAANYSSSIVDDLTRCQDELFEIVLFQLEKQLVDKQFLCSEQSVTFPDIQYYTEIQQIKQTYRSRSTYDIAAVNDQGYDHSNDVLS